MAQMQAVGIESKGNGQGHQFTPDKAAYDKREVGNISARARESYNKIRPLLLCFEQPSTDANLNSILATYLDIFKGLDNFVLLYRPEGISNKEIGKPNKADNQKREYLRSLMTFNAKELELITNAYPCLKSRYKDAVKNTENIRAEEKFKELEKRYDPSKSTLTDGEKGQLKKLALAAHNSFEELSRKKVCFNVDRELLKARHSIDVTEVSKTPSEIAMAQRVASWPHYRPLNDFLKIHRPDGLMDDVLFNDIFRRNTAKDIESRLFLRSLQTFNAEQLKELTLGFPCVAASKR